MLSNNHTHNHLRPQVSSGTHELCVLMHGCRAAFAHCVICLRTTLWGTVASQVQPLFKRKTGLILTGAAASMHASILTGCCPI